MCPWASLSPSLGSPVGRRAGRGRACSVAGSAQRRLLAPQLLCIDASTRRRSPLGAGRGALPAKPSPDHGAGAEPQQLQGARSRFCASRRCGPRPRWSRGAPLPTPADVARPPLGASLGPRALTPASGSI